MLQSVVIALFIGLWTLALIGLGAEPNPWISVKSGQNWREWCYRSRSRRIRYLSAAGNGQRYRSIELLSM